ncbi:hypothetical protein NWF32_10460 [Pseudomonas qingdaonensis]|nr:hypothetical protein [Pseudomonas qingdaonensis]
MIKHQFSHAKRNKSRANYKQAEYIEERRQMMKVWADEIDAQIMVADAPDLF